MKKLDKIRCTRVQPRFTRKHKNSMSRVKRTIAKLQNHYGDAKRVANPFDIGSELSGFRSGGTPDRLMRITQDDDVEDHSEFTNSVIQDRGDPRQGIMTHHGFRIKTQKDRVKSVVMTEMDDSLLRSQNFEDQKIEYHLSEEVRAEDQPASHFTFELAAS